MTEGNGCLKEKEINMAARRRKRHLGLKIFLGIVLVVVIVGFVMKDQISSGVKDKAAEVVVEKLLDEKIAKDTAVYGDKTASDIYESMDSEDQEAVKSIVEEHLDQETISEATSYLTSGDTAGLKEYVKENLSEEEKQEVQDLYEKYKDQLAQ